MLLLSQSSSDAMGDVFLAAAGIALIIVVAAVVVLVVRRKMTDTPGDLPADGGSILSSLRTLRDSGQISQEEFDRVKAKLVNKAQKELADVPEVIDPLRRGDPKRPGLLIQDKGPKPDRVIPDQE